MDSRFIEFFDELATRLPELFHSEYHSVVDLVNYPGDREYTLNALLEEVALAERHLRDGSFKLCTCNIEKHFPLIAGLASEGVSFAEDDTESAFLVELHNRVRIAQEALKRGLAPHYLDVLREWLRQTRHAIDERRWT